MYKQVVRPFDPLPAPVAVHCIIAPHDRRDPARAYFPRLLLEIPGVPEAAARIGVATVRKGMDAHPVSGQPLLRGKAQQGVQMVQRGMHAPVRKQPHKMQSRTPFGGMARGCKQGLVVEKLAVLDRFVDACNFLIDHPACSEIHVTHLGISHLPVR